MALRKNNPKDYKKFADTKKDVLGNDRNIDPPKSAPGDTTVMSSKYKVGDHADEYEFEDAFKKQHKGYPQLSVQDYSRIRKGKNGENIVVKLKEGEYDD
jgi:hypothetical protein